MSLCKKCKQWKDNGNRFCDDCAPKEAPAEVAAANTEGEEPPAPPADSDPNE